MSEYTDGEFIPQPAIQRQVARESRLAFMERFADQELVSIYDAAKTSTAVFVWLEKLRSIDSIDPHDPRTIAGAKLLESAGVIAEGRADEILGIASAGTDSAVAETE